ncbi:MAG: D-alanine--D-alanine ligase [Candidatus Saccharibacteria bacterium]|nr:D-alanine--D-alanine ligase [Candidatus Saccharibacteria bacterium]
MSKIIRHIEIVRSTIPSLSSLSAPSATAIQRVLSEHYSDAKITLLNDLNDLDMLIERKPDLVFLGLKYIFKDKAKSEEKIWITEYLESKGIACTGSTSLAHKLELDKSLAKQCVIDAGLVTSPFYVAKQHSNVLNQSDSLVFPMFVKPSDRGGGLGVDRYSVVHNIDQLNTKVASISLNHNADSLVEQYLSGREFSVAILSDSETGVLHTMPLELIAPLNNNGDRLLSSDIKEADSENVIPITDEKLALSISILALSVFRALGARDYGRIDIRLDKNGVPNFLEANLIPSLIENYGSFAKACMLHKNLEHTEMIIKIAELAFDRTPEKQQHLATV